MSDALMHGYPKILFFSSPHCTPCRPVEEMLKRINLSMFGKKLYIEKIFEYHKKLGWENFQNFYEAQAVWEDTMAESIANYPCKGPMVVLAGNSHIIYKFGIPDRAYQINPMAFKTIYLASAGTTAELDYADFIWVTPEFQIIPEILKDHP